MKKITHWLQLGGMNIGSENEKKQWNNLIEYVKNNESEIIVYNKNTGDIYSKVIKLICIESYNDMDLDVNSNFDGSIRHLNSKPKNIEICRKQLDYFQEK